MFHNKVYLDINGVSKENTVLRELLDILMIGCIEREFLGNVNSMGILRCNCLVLVLSVFTLLKRVLV